MKKLRDEIKNRVGGWRRGADPWKGMRQGAKEGEQWAAAIHDLDSKREIPQSLLIPGRRKVQKNRYGRGGDSALVIARAPDEEEKDGFARSRSLSNLYRGRPGKHQ